MSGLIIPNAKQQYLDGNGNPLAGGFVYYYIPSTTTFKNTYQNAALTILNTNPIILDSAGECIAYGLGSYRQIVTDVNGNLIWDQPTYAFPNDALNITYTPPFTNGVAETVSAKLAQMVSVKDFGAVGDNTTDDTTAIQNAINYAVQISVNSQGVGGVYLPAGVYKVTASLTASRPIQFLGLGLPTLIAYHNNPVLILQGIPNSSTFPDGKNIVQSINFKNYSSNTPASFIQLGTASGATPTYINSENDAEINDCIFHNVSATYIIENMRGFGLAMRGCIFSSVTATAVFKARQNLTEIPYWTYAVDIYSCDFTGITGKAIEADGGDITVYGGIIEGCSVGAVDIGLNSSYTVTRLVSFYGTYFEQNTNYHVQDHNNSCLSFNGCKFVSGGITSYLRFGSGSSASFYSCSSPNNAPTIIGGNIYQYACSYMGQNVGSVDSFRDNKPAYQTTTPITSYSFGSRLNVNQYGGGSALIACSHSNGGTTATNAELYFIMFGVNGNNFTAQSLIRVVGTDTATYNFSVDANGYLQVASPNAGVANYYIVYQTAGVYTL